MISIATPLAAVVGIGGRRRRLRAEVRDNLSLLEELKKDEILSTHTPAIGWIAGKIALDVARLSGQPLGARKKPVPRGAVIFAALLTVGLGYWTYVLTRDGFVWYSVFPGTGAALFAISILGMFTNRQIPDDPDLPDGATPVQSSSAQERIASSVQLAASGADQSMFDDDGQAGVALRFVELMRKGQYELALDLADTNWNLCRIQARLWNMHQVGNLPRNGLEDLASSLLAERKPEDFWRGYVEAEAEQFAEAWSQFSSLGAASRRRRVARDYDLVVLAPLGSTGGYFVTTATAVPNALPILMHRVEGRWLVANHVGGAPPTPGWPPTWWAPGDQTFANLPADADATGATAAPAS